MFVKAIPFSTETLASYLHHGGRDSHLAAAIYGLPVLGVALSFTALCAWAARPGLLHVAVGAAGRLSSCAVSLPGRSRSWPRSVRRSWARSPRWRHTQRSPLTTEPGPEAHVLHAADAKLRRTPGACAVPWSLGPVHGRIAVTCRDSGLCRWLGVHERASQFVKVVRLGSFPGQRPERPDRQAELL